MPILLGLIALTLVEIALFVWMGGAVGVWPVLALVLLSGLVGIGALRGRMARLPELARAGADPAVLLAGGAMTVLGAGLLILPGFVTDLVGLALLLPWVQHRVAARLGRGRGGAEWQTTVIEGEFEVRDPSPPEVPGLPPHAAPRRH
jgi:UPF0716 protein FxsA